MLWSTNAKKGLFVYWFFQKFNCYLLVGKSAFRDIVAGETYFYHSGTLWKDDQLELFVERSLRLLQKTDVGRTTTTIERCAEEVSE